MAKKPAFTQKPKPFTAPSGHKSVGITPPFVSNKPAPSTPAVNKGIAPKGSKKGMC